jgi:hypothetical protein
MSGEGERKLVKETKWSRKYLIAPTRFLYESKFLADGLDINAENLVNQWPTMTASERHDFALAFQCTGKLTQNDESILLFLMRAGDGTVWRTISLILSRHSDRESVTQFLLARLRETFEARSNYYQAAELVGDARFVEVLEDQFADYRL